MLLRKVIIVNRRVVENKDKLYESKSPKQEHNRRNRITGQRYKLICIYNPTPIAHERPINALFINEIKYYY
jgi:hypothetical protein